MSQAVPPRPAKGGSTKSLSNEGASMEEEGNGLSTATAGAAAELLALACGSMQYAVSCKAGWARLLLRFVGLAFALGTALDTASGETP